MQFCGDGQYAQASVAANRSHALAPGSSVGSS